MQTNIISSVSKGRLYKRFYGSKKCVFIEREKKSNACCLRSKFHKLMKKYLNNFIQIYLDFLIFIKIKKLKQKFGTAFSINKS